MANLLHEVVTTFLPDRVRQQFLERSEYRMQGPPEPLADFIIEIRETADIVATQT